MIKAIIMAGGEGTRLRPLTCNRPKPMIPVINMPVIEHAVELLKKHEINDIIISLFYLPEVVQNYFGDGSEWNVTITYSVEETPLGTAGGVRQAIEDHDDTFIVLSGDGIIDFDITDILRFHREKESPFTIVLTSVNQPTEYGIVITDEKTGRIEKFLEKPAWSEVFSNTANTGMYVIEPEIMNRYVPRNIKFDFSLNLFPILQQNGTPLYGYIADGYWCDVGNLQSYNQIHYDILERLVDVKIPGKKIGPDIWVGQDVDIHPEAEVQGPVIIGNYVKIKKGAEVAESSVIGHNCVIEENASIRKSIVLHSTIIGPKSELRGAVIGKRCVLENNVSVYEGAVISDDCTLEMDATVSAGIRVWPDKTIEQKTHLTTDFIWGHTTSKTLFGSEGILGTFNVKITPEFASRLGSALGAFIGRDSQVVISRDNSNAARIIKRSFTAGLLSMGIDVFDMEVASIPINRYSTRFLNSDLGVYLQMAPFTGMQYIQIRIYSGNGYQLLIKDEKKIENIFYRGDYPRRNAYETGRLIYPTHHIESYITNTERYLDRDVLINKKWNLIVDCFHGTTSHVFPELLNHFGCNATIMRGQMREFRSESDIKTETRNALKNIIYMAEINREIGIIIGPHGSQINIVDELGKILTQDDICAMLSFYYLKYHDGKIINIPATASSELENHILALGGSVQRTGIHLREPENTPDIFLGGDSGYYPYLELNYDPMVSALRVLEYLTREEKKLYEIREDLPKSNLLSTSIHCSGEQKAAIMRMLSSATDDNRMEMIDGLKIYQDDAWILMIPDAVQPLIHLYAEGSDMESRDDILNRYSIRIKRFKQSLENEES